MESSSRKRGSGWAKVGTHDQRAEGCPVCQGAGVGSNGGCGRQEADLGGSGCQAESLDYSEGCRCQERAEDGGELPPASGPARSWESGLEVSWSQRVWTLDRSCLSLNPSSRVQAGLKVPWPVVWRRHGCLSQGVLRPNSEQRCVPALVGLHVRMGIREPCGGFPEFSSQNWAWAWIWQPEKSPACLSCSENTRSSQ